MFSRESAAKPVFRDRLFDESNGGSSLIRRVVPRPRIRIEALIQSDVNKPEKTREEQRCTIAQYLTGLHLGKIDFEPTGAEITAGHVDDAVKGKVAKVEIPRQAARADHARYAIRRQRCETDYGQPRMSPTIYVPPSSPSGVGPPNEPTWPVSIGHSVCYRPDDTEQECKNNAVNVTSLGKSMNSDVF